MGTLLKQFMAGVGGGRSWNSFWKAQIAAYALRVDTDGGTIYNGADGTFAYLTDRNDLLTKAYYDEALLIMVPSAVKAGTLYSVKGADFGFARNLQKWVVNASNILYSSAVNVPALRWDGGRARWEFDKENAAVTLNTRSLEQDYYLGQQLQYTRFTNTQDSPFGAGTADGAMEVAAAGNHIYYGSQTRVNGTTYVNSLIVKGIGRTGCYVMRSEAEPPAAVVFDFVAMTATVVAGTATAGIESYGDGYYRVWMRVTASSDGNANSQFCGNTTTSFTGEIDKGFIIAHHQKEINTLSSPIVAGTSATTRPEDIATATAVIDTDNPYTFVYNLSGQTYIEVYKDGNKTTYIDGVLDGTVVQAPSADITLSAVGRYGHFIAFGRELTESEMGFFLSNNPGIDTDKFSIDTTNISIDLT